jgi:hypothetical protein
MPATPVQPSRPAASWTGSSWFSTAGRVSRDVLAEALRAHWPGVRREHVMGLNARRTLEVNLRNLARDPLKARMTREVGEDRRGWLDEAKITQLATWMCSIDVRRFRFSFGICGSVPAGR